MFLRKGLFVKFLAAFVLSLGLFAAPYAGFAAAAPELVTASNDVTSPDVVSVDAVSPDVEPELYVLPDFLKGCKTWSAEFVRTIVKWYNLDVANARDREGNTALHYAAQNPNPGVINVLVLEFNVPPDARNNAGDTTLHIAVLNNNITAQRQLVGMALWYIPNNKGIEALPPTHLVPDGIKDLDPADQKFMSDMLAVSRTQKTIYDYILEDNLEKVAEYFRNARPDLFFNKEGTALEFAARNNASTAMIESILDYGASPEALDAAVAAGRQNIYALLKDRGAKRVSPENADIAASWDAGLASRSSGDLIVLMKEGAVSAMIRGNGMTSSVKMDLINNKPYPVTVNIPRGTYFKSNTNKQDMAVIVPEIVELAEKGAKSLTVAVACMNVIKKVPVSSDSFEAAVLNESANPELTRLTKLMSDNNEPSYVTQCAVWRLTDKESDEKCRKRLFLHNMYEDFGQEGWLSQSINIDWLLQAIEDNLSKEEIEGLTQQAERDLARIKEYVRQAEGR